MKNLVFSEDDIKLKLEKQVQVGDLLIDVPLKYRCGAINAIFPVSTKKVKEIIKTKKIRPLEVWPGRSLLCVTLFNFHSGPVGAYTEISLSIPVAYRPFINIPSLSIFIKKTTKKIAFFVVSIAQSTKLAIEHGLAITGYPRYSLTKLISIDFKEDNNFVYANAFGDGKKILEIKIKKPIKEDINKEFYDTYLIKDGKISTAFMESHGYVGETKIDKFELGDHEIADFMRKLEMSPKAFDVRYYEDIIKVVHESKVLEDI